MNGRARITTLVDDEAGPGLVVEHGLSFWIETGEGLVVCLGCCHAGLENTLAHVFSLRPTHFRALLGGLHRQQADPEPLARGASALAACAPDRVVPCHCSGHAARQVLRQSLGERVDAGRRVWLGPGVDGPAAGC